MFYIYFLTFIWYFGVCLSSNIGRRSPTCNELNLPSTYISQLKVVSLYMLMYKKRKQLTKHGIYDECLC